MSVVPAVYPWADNSALIADVAKLGYLDGKVLDPTFGMGTWWKKWQPEYLVATDIDPAKNPFSGNPIDFTDLPGELRGPWDAIAFDPPYKLNGTPSDPDERYGVGLVASWQERHELICRGIAHLSRFIRPGGYLLLKCQDQVCSGAVRWQTRDFAVHAERHRLVQVDRFDMIGHARPQPMNSRRQRHAHGRPSTLLVFRATA